MTDDATMLATIDGLAISPAQYDYGFRMRMVAAKPHGVEIRPFSCLVVAHNRYVREVFRDGESLGIVELQP